MCLSTVYKQSAAPENLVLRNVQKIECKDGQILLTDIMERQVAIEGEILMADLIGGMVVINERLAS